MSATAEVHDLVVEDLRTWITLGLGRGQALLTAGEITVARRILALQGEAARTYARLSGRVRSVFAVDRLELPGVDDPAAAVQVLVAQGLLCRFVPWPRRLEVLTVEELKEACRAEGLRVGGRRAALIERLEGRRVGRERDVVRVVHEGLVLRLLRFALGRIQPDRSQGVMQRIGVVRWPEYTRTRGAAVLPTRAALRAWEALLASTLSPEDALGVLEDATRQWPPGRLDPRRRLRRAIAEAARDCEREGELERAEALYRRLAARVGVARHAVRLSRVVERQGRAEEALALLEQGRREARLGERVAIERAGRRVAKSLRRAWVPSPPLRKVSERRVALALDEGERTRPTWEGGQLIEPAVGAHVEAAGRTVLAAEGPLWRTLFALLFAEAYFLPVPGQLPAPFLSGPLDLGTPGFRRRRVEAVDRVLDAVRRGEAAERVRDAAARWWDTRLRGARWDLASADELAQVAGGLAPRALCGVLEVLLGQGLRASAGMPDLVVLPGDAVRVEHLHPSRLSAGLALIEVKGPSDSLRDEQRAWHHRLHEAGARVEVWRVRPR